MKNKLDSLRLECIRQFSEIATHVGLEFVIVGAAARDLILFNLHSIETRRRTEDIDFAVLINDWDLFDSLRLRLLSIEHVTEGDAYHRIIFQGVFPIDIIPFGKVEDKDGKVRLPPDFNFKLNMEGFKEVFENSIQIELDDILSVNVTSLAGLAILKIFAWRNRIKNSDAFDLSIIILETAVDRPQTKIIFYRPATYPVLALPPQDESAYAYNCTYLRLIYLTAKALRRMTMRGFLVGANKPQIRTLKRVQLRFLGL